MNDHELPPGWCWASVEGLALVTGGLTRHGAKRANAKASVPLVTVASVGLRKIDPESFGEIGLLDSDGSSAMLEVGDILVVEGNGSLGHIGRAALWDGCVPSARHQNHLIRVRPSLMPSEFLLEWLSSPLGRRLLVEQATSAAGLYNLSLTKVGRILAPVPPLNEQKRIVAKIEALQARSNAAKEALDAIPPLLEKLRQSVLAAAFRGDLTRAWREAHPDVEPASVLLERIRTERRRKWEAANPKKKYVEPEAVDADRLPKLPSGWFWGSLDELAEVQLGQRRAPEYVGEAEYSYIRSANITWGGLDLSDVKSMGFADAEPLKLRKGDILLNEASGSPTEVGKPALWNDEIPDCCFQATVVRLRVYSTEMSPRWLYFNCLRDAVLAEYAARCPGLGIIHLTAKVLRMWPVPVAPLEEQNAIMGILPNLLNAIASGEARHVELRRQLDTLNQSILAKAFRGELVPQDPTDEPASALLERIRAERESATTTPKPRATKRPRKPASTR